MVDSEPEVIYEDEVVLVINKPAGMVVNRAKSVTGKTVQDWAEKRLGMLVHRLDKETSGVMVIAKTEEVLVALQRQFKERKVAKTYVALVYGKLVPRAGVIAVPIGRSRQNREKFAVVPGGRPAETGYQVKEYFQGYTLVELRPKTGRTHQLRVHLAYLGHPVVGDERYAGVKQRRQERARWGRHLLHAQSLSLIHPMTGRWVHWQADLPEELKV